MAQVTGIGGVFLRSPDPKALARWYSDALGIPSDPGAWVQQDGPTVFAPFAADSDYFPRDRAVMLNFRVDDLDGMLAHLNALAIEAETRPEEWDSEIGRFARIHDPDGNPIELWEPAGPAAA